MEDSDLGLDLWDDARPDICGYGHSKTMWLRFKALRSIAMTCSLCTSRLSSPEVTSTFPTLSFGVSIYGLVSIGDSLSLRQPQIQGATSQCLWTRVSRRCLIRSLSRMMKDTSCGTRRSPRMRQRGRY